MEKEKKKLSLKDIGIPRLVIILLCGVLLIVLSFPGLLSSNKKSKDNNQIEVLSSQIKAVQSDYANQMEEKLKEALRKVEGVGDVDVTITLKSSKERVTLKDTPYSEENLHEKDSTGGNRENSKIEKNEETVLQNDGSGTSSPYVVKELEPEIEGILVVAQGGGTKSIISEIVDAVEVLFDVPAHKIKVMKMNSK